MQGQIGSGSLPVERLPSAGLALAAVDGRGRTLEALAVALLAGAAGAPGPLTPPPLGASAAASR